MAARKTASPYDLFSKDLVNVVRSEADKRIARSLKEFDMGLVLSMNPLQIQPLAQTTQKIILEADEVLVIPGVPIEQGMTVALVRTRNNETIAFPIILGKDVQPSPTFTGTPGVAGTDPNSTVVQSEPSVGGPAGERVIAKALSYVGTKETGTNTDGGGPIDGWITAWGLTPGPNSPWCGMFADAMYKEAGVDDQGIGDPFTGAIRSKAATANAVRATPVKGCFAVNDDHHVTLYIGGPLEAADCVGGNQSDSVSRRVYDIRGWTYCCPAAILIDAVASTPASTTNGTSGAASPRPAPPDGKVT